MAERKEQEWRRGVERSDRDLHEAYPNTRQQKVKVGSWRCLGRKHRAVHPWRVTKSDAEATGDLMRQKKWTTQVQVSCTFVAQTHQGRRQRVRGQKTLRTLRAASPAGMSKEPGEEEQTRSLTGKRQPALRADRMER